MQSLKVEFIEATPVLMEEKNRKRLMAMGYFLYEVGEGGCLLIVSHKPHQNGSIRIFRRGKCHYLHRIVWEMEHGPVPEGFYVSQKCGNPRCVNPTHLRLITAKEISTKRHRRRPEGQNTFSPLLPNGERVEIIRRMFFCGLSNRIIGRVFGLSQQTVKMVEEDIRKGSDCPNPKLT